MATIDPIKPEDVASGKLEAMPSIVIKIFNKMIAQKWKGSSATFKQDDIVAELREHGGFSESYIYENDFLDIEPIYREAGWKVEYDSPAYCESYPATYTFKK